MTDEHNHISGSKMDETTMDKWPITFAVPRNLPVTGLHVSADVSPPYTMGAFRVQHYDVRANDADGYSEISTKDLPRDLTAWELAQIMDLTIRAPNYVVRRDFAAVAHLFKPVE